MSERRTPTRINRSAILRLLAQGPKPVARLSRILRVSPSELWPAIDDLTAAGQVQADKHSYYHVRSDDDEPESAACDESA